MSHATPTAATGCTPSPRQGLRSLALLASIVAVFLAASSAPSPLYEVYRAQWHFSALVLTAVFAIYAFTLLAALLLFGRLSDHVGRKPVLLGAIVLQLLSLAVFHQADGVAGLLAARALQGLATGIATSVLGAALIDVSRERGALLNGLAPMIGMGIGSLGTGLLLQMTSSPTTLPYELLFAVLALQGLAVAGWLPETVSPREGAWRSLRPQVAIPSSARVTLARILPVNTAQWALGGFYLSLGPTLARQVTGSHAPALGGALIATLVLPAALAIYRVRALDAARVLRGGTTTLIVGLLVTLAGVASAQSALFFGGTALAGLGFGAAFNGALRSLVPLATPHQRGGLMSGFFVLSYLAFSLPALAAGLAVGQVGVMPTALGFGLLLVLMSLGARLAMRGAMGSTGTAPR